ncbi:MAG TPA: (2Fe-2S)-binding protein [Anaeromyxobacter sp.]|nr:(2Fe-2S)-binding protein [Anaeromyxobacter sp.]
MIVCVCRGISDRSVREARARGARTLDAVGTATGAGTDCGCCHDTIARVLAEPCRAEPCAGCPRGAAGGAVPRRIAAAGEGTL